MTANRNIVASNDGVEKAQAHLHKLVERGLKYVNKNDRNVIKAMQAVVKVANKNNDYHVKSQSPIYNEIIRLFTEAKEKFKQAEWFEEIRLLQAQFFEKTNKTEDALAIYKSIKNKLDSPCRWIAAEAYMDLCESLGKDGDSLASAEEIVNADKSTNIKRKTECLSLANKIIMFRRLSPDLISEEDNSDLYLSKSAPAILK